MKATFALIFVALLSWSSSQAQSGYVAAVARLSLDKVDGPWAIQYSTLRDGGFLQIETSDGESSTLEIPTGSSVRLIGHRLEMKGYNLELDLRNLTIFVGDVKISVVPTRLVSRNGTALFNKSKTQLRFKDAAVVLSRYKS